MASVKMLKSPLFSNHKKFQTSNQSKALNIYHLTRPLATSRWLHGHWQGGWGLYFGEILEAIDFIDKSGP